jgi:hypothetical protein
LLVKGSHIMANPLGTYLEDHLAGAAFAVSLLEDLRDNGDETVRSWAGALLPEIEADRRTLQQLADAVGDGGSVVKESTAWLAHKASRVKLSPNDALGLFEALEMLSLGILGKRALWQALRVIPSRFTTPKLDLDALEARAISQYDSTEQLRLSAAPGALTVSS